MLGNGWFMLVSGMGTRPKLNLRLR
jgi:hypothetical protein